MPTATAAAAAASRFPLRAYFGEPRPFSARMNPTAASR